MFALPTARLLPLLMVMAMLTLGMRGYDFWHEINYGSTATAAPEEHAAPAHPAEPAPAAAPPAAPAGPATALPGSAMVGDQPAPAATGDGQAEPAEDVPGDFTPAEVQVLQNLAQRRAELDRRAAELDQREALVEAAQQSVEEKVKELQALRTELQELMHTVDAQQQERITSLVKIYETMKPREAAAILETLEMPVALDVLEQMREAKSAPILAAMNPQKASAITVEMSRRRQLPEIPQ